MTITIDTSVFIELLLGRDRAKESEALLNLVAEGQIEAVVSHFAVHAVGAMIRSQQKLSEFLKDVETSKGLQVYDTTICDEQSVSILSGKMGLDFDDSVQFYVAKRTVSLAIVSYDKHFDKLDIPRTEPSQLMKNIHNAERKRNAERENISS